MLAAPDFVADLASPVRLNCLPHQLSVPAFNPRSAANAFADLPFERQSEASSDHSAAVRPPFIAFTMRPVCRLSGAAHRGSL